MTEWVKISDMEKARAMAMRADGVSPLSAEDIPDTHTITVSERSISVDNSEIIQNNIKTDLIELALDGEWYDCGSIYVTLGRSAGYEEPVQLEWEGTALTFPAQLGTEVGGIDVSVVGYGNDGEMRLVTKASNNTFRVVASGYVEDVPPTEENLDILAQLVQKGDAAEDAADAANAAATSATAAASSANKAATSATSAATSANSAATKANSAAVDAQNAYDTLQPYMATIDSCANVLHSEVGPDSVVTADDSFPCKPVEMTVFGNTVQNLWVNPSGTSNGVTATANADGSVTFSGTSTGDFYIYPIVYSLKPGSTYTLSIDKDIDANVSIQPFNSDGYISDIAMVGDDRPLTNTGVFPQNATHARLMIQGQAGRTLSGTYRIMLNEGSEAQPWCPPGLNSVGDDGSVEVVTAGKNYFPRLNSGAFKGITVTANSDGSYTLNGTSTATDAGVVLNNVSGIPNGQELTLSSYGYDDTIVKIQIFYKDVDGTTVYQDVFKTPKTFTIPENARDVGARVALDSAGGTVNNVTVYPQLELGSTATDYEPPSITTTPIDLQGHTLNSLPDGTRDELHIDGGGNVVLEKRTGIYAYDGTETFNAIDNPYWAGVVATTLRGVNSFRDAVSQDRTYCDKLPPVSGNIMKGGTSNGILFVDSEFTGTNNNVAYRVLSTSNPEDVKEIMTGGKVIYKLAEPQTIDLGTITPPTMAAPNVTAYVADDTPAEMTLDYVRDVNIVHSRLEERVAALELASATS